MSHHKTRKCLGCDLSFVMKYNAPHQLYCSKSCYNRKRNRDRKTWRRAALAPPQNYDLTPLNIRTQKRYEKCGGKHTPSNKIVERGAMRWMLVCAKCDVPYREIVRRMTAVVS